MSCRHLNFDCSADVVSVGENAGNVTYNANISMRCRDCGHKLRFHAGDSSADGLGIPVTVLTPGATAPDGLAGFTATREAEKLCPA